MTRSQLIAEVAKETDMPVSQIDNIFTTITDTIIDALRRDEKVTIAGFGRFEMRHRKTKAFTNPKTKETSQLPPTSIPGFKASGILKDLVIDED